MLWLFTALATETTLTASAPGAHLVAIFEEQPSPRASRKAVRYAMRKSKTLVGGKDWGRALCFQFESEPDAEVIRAAAAKTGIPAVVRDAENCIVPPHEALMPAKPGLVLAVRMPQEVPPADIRNELTKLLGVGGLGLMGVHTLDEPAKAFCMSFAEPPDPSVLEFTLQSLPFPTTTAEPVDTCRDAFLQ